MAIPESIVEDLDNQGYCVIEDTSETDMWDVASELGMPRQEMRDGQVVKLIRPQPEQVSFPNTLSSRYGLGSFPFHTDAAYWFKPPRYLILRCVNPGEGNRCTLLSDTRAWLSNDQWNLLSEAICSIAGRRYFLATIADSDADRVTIVRYDTDCMRPTGKRSSEALALLGKKAAESQSVEIHWRHGSTLVVDNHRLLHARGTSQFNDPNRLHQKILVEEGPT